MILKIRVEIQDTKTNYRAVKDRTIDYIKQYDLDETTPKMELCLVTIDDKKKYIPLYEPFEDEITGFTITNIYSAYMMNDNAKTIERIK